MTPTSQEGTEPCGECGASWSGEFVARDTSLFRLSEQYTEESMLKKVYEDEDVITLEDLPDLKTYKIRKGL